MHYFGLLRPESGPLPHGGGEHRRGRSATGGHQSGACGRGTRRRGGGPAAGRLRSGSPHAVARAEGPGGIAKIAKYGGCEIGHDRPQNPKHPNNPNNPFRRDVDEVEFESSHRCAHEKFSVTPWGKCPNSFIYYSKIQHHV